ncbi:hypothetical protein KIN20_005136 [Parelaphostrongylus tenuis]|uniref:Uncharacterized protein n=1 Tax=Parelaphostrongylus tenuis TaxID=148309 RepID=A0AAD5MKR9_PARTN|nr:hypothetical protein KIN20_005136 [Parelaphostrongylus tenuis]
MRVLTRNAWNIASTDSSFVSSESAGEVDLRLDSLVFFGRTDVDVRRPLQKFSLDGMRRNHQEVCTDARANAYYCETDESERERCELITAHIVVKRLIVLFCAKAFEFASLFSCGWCHT